MRWELVAIALLAGCGSSRLCEPRAVEVTGDFATDLPGTWALCGIDSCWLTTFSADGGAVNHYRSGDFPTRWSLDDAGFYYGDVGHFMFAVTDAGLVLDGRRFHACHPPSR